MLRPRPGSDGAQVIEFVTTLLCMLPPSVGNGWQMIASNGRGAASGRSCKASMRPAGPSMNKDASAAPGMLLDGVVMSP